MTLPMLDDEEEEAYTNEAKRILKQLETIIFARKQNLEICLWRTLDSTIDIMFIFTSKLTNSNDRMNHLKTIVNASTLLSSIIKVILSRFQHDETTVLETLAVVNRLGDTVQKMKLSAKEQKLSIIRTLHQLASSLLFVFLVNEKQQSINSSSGSNNRRVSIRLMTPPLTPNRDDSSILSDELTCNTSSSFCNTISSRQKYTAQHELDPLFCYQGGMQHPARVYEQSDKIKSSGDTVGKRFIRSISALKKAHLGTTYHATVLDEDDDYYQQRQKIDEERISFVDDIAKTADLNSNKGSLRMLFSHSKRQNTTDKKGSHQEINGLFGTNSECPNQKSSAHTLKSPYSRKVAQSENLVTSDSGCFTNSHFVHKPTLQRSLTSIQREYAEPVFIKQKERMKANRSENDLCQMISLLKTPSASDEPALHHNGWFRERAARKVAHDRLYDLSTEDNEEDEIMQHAKTKGREGSVLHISENDQDVMVVEMVSNKLQVLAGTLERLFMKLADETCQDLDYVDTYILSHLFFTDSHELLENLMARFHLEAMPGEATCFKKWQRCIQVKVLNVISRWIKLQFQDFLNNPILITRLEAFLNGDVNRAGFAIEADMIKEAVDRQRIQFSQSQHTLIIQTSQSLVSFGNTTLCSPPSSTAGLSRRPSTTPSFLSFVSYSTPPESPTYPSNACGTTLLSMNSKDVAKYLTLADFYILKCITAQDYLAMYYPQKHQKKTQKSSSSSINYISLMTERANKLTRWVHTEISAHKSNSKQRRAVVRKMIEIAKACLSWSNFHTCMVITMGISQLEEFRQGEWQQNLLLPNRDMLTYKHLLKYLNVCNNMSYYRTAFRKSAKAPCIPFFPIVLKDLMFLMDGNATKKQDGLINFTKFRVLIQSVHTVLSYTVENYYFASELEIFPFFPQQCSSGSCTLSLDRVASTLEAQINEQSYVTQYIQ